MEGGGAGPVVVHLVVARHREDLGWLAALLDERPAYEAWVYNDGPAGDLPRHPRLHVEPGDGLPCEPAKYALHVLAHWGAGWPAATRVAFLQADPHYHNPTVGALLRAPEAWAPRFQNLGLWGHPPPWGCAAALARGEAPGIERLPGGGAAWSDRMGNDFQGEFYRDPWVAQVTLGNGPAVLASDVAGTLAVPFQLPAVKTYAALFATTWGALRELHGGRGLWERVVRFVARGCPRTAHLEPKLRAALLEYMWPSVFGAFGA